jgi:hypothetical protein
MDMCNYLFEKPANNSRGNNRFLLPNDHIMTHRDPKPPRNPPDTPGVRSILVPDEEVLHVKPGS